MLPPPRRRAPHDALHFAAATAASLIFPFAPHTGADAYDALTGDRVWEQPWPAADPAYLERDTVTVVVQVNGKVRDRFEAAAGHVRARSSRRRRRALPNAAAHIDGKRGRQGHRRAGQARQLRRPLNPALTSAQFRDESAPRSVTPVAA